MTCSKSKPDLYIIAGPTASGKTARAIELAMQNDGEIINADSLQVYNDLKILSAYPTRDELSKCPHHMFGYLNFDESTSAAEWACMASSAIKDIQSRGKLPIIAGGTGLYIYILLNGISPLPEVSEETRQKANALANENFQKLLDEIHKSDESLKNSITRATHRQAIRAYEIFLETGRPITYFYRQQKIKFIDDLSYEVEVIDMPREVIYDRINRRFLHMLDIGALEEMEDFLNRFQDTKFEDILKFPIFKCLGAKELALHIKSKINFNEMVDLAQTASRHYAKRQITWFKKFLK